MSYLPIISDVILHIVNLCITINVFPLPCKSSIVTPFVWEDFIAKDQQKAEINNI